MESSDIIKNVLVWRKAFNHYRDQYKILKDDLNNVKVLEKAKSEGVFIHGTSRSAIVKNLPKNTDNVKTDTIEDVVQMKRFLNYIRALTKGIEQPIKWKKDDTGTEVPKLSKGQFVEENTGTESYKIFYWSRAFGAVNEGKLILKNKNFIVEMVKPFKLGDDKKTAQINGTFEKSGHTCYIHLKRSAGNEDILSQIIFEQNNTGKDIFIGTFSSATYNTQKPYAGLIVLVPVARKITDDLRAMITYVLHDKRVQPEIVNFHWNKPDHYPYEIKMWNEIKKELAGIYQGYFANPFTQRFEVCKLEIEKTGLVSIYDSVIMGTDKKVYRGISRIGVGKLEFSTKKLIIQADYSMEFLEYRIKIYLDIDEFLHRELNSIKGIYTCFRWGDGMPFASKFFLKKIEGMEDSDFNESIYHIPIKNSAQLGKLKKFLTAEGIDKFFFGSQNNLLQPFAIDIA